jgi:hypothetical protein
MGFALVEGAWGSVSLRSDAERVGVIGQDAPLSPDLTALVAFQPGSVQRVASFEATDPALGAGSVALQAADGSLGSWLLAARDLTAPPAGWTILRFCGVPGLPGLCDRPRYHRTTSGPLNA